MAALTFPQVGDRLVGAVQARLAVTPAGAAGRATVVAGRPELVAWDDCCKGLLYVATGRVYGSDSFPAERGAGTPGPGLAGGSTRVPEWAGMLVAEMALVLVRCAAVPLEPDQLAVPPATQRAEATTQDTDAYEALVAVVCELEAMRRAAEVDDYLVRDQPTVGPQGDCQGSQLNLLVAVPFLCPCPGLT
jgi:hypothetical protein